MKWSYGKQDWSTFERGEENGWLMTNGLGGFASTNQMGGVSRGDQALLMAALKAPNVRACILHRLKEEVDGIPCSSQAFADGTREEGFRFLSAFSFEDTPWWIFHIKGAELHKEAAMIQGENAIGIRYELHNRSSWRVELVVTPFFRFAPKGQEPDSKIHMEINGNLISSGPYQVTLHTNGRVEKTEELREIYFYQQDARDGRQETGTGVSNHRIRVSAEPGERVVLDLVYSLGAEALAATAEDMIREAKEYRKKLENQSGLTSQLGKALAGSAGQFISRRDSTDGKTILAGFPFFEDWGRDTMIALPGICISTGRFEEAREILRTFALYERDGLMPNLFPEGGQEPMYNTADAALLFIHCVYYYVKASGDMGFFEEMRPVMERIVNGYKAGARFNIGMDKDGLIRAGAGLDQVTWMDVRAGNILPTPRHGKPVEINVYWYNGLKMLEELLAEAGEKERSAVYGRMAVRAREAFNRLFWMEKKGYLKDVVSEKEGQTADTQLRCNQIWAVSMPFSILDRNREKRVVETVFEKLYTPYGLRTLECEDPQFHPFYGGSMLERDLAYHQGTVWVFPLGAFFLAELKVNDYSLEAAEWVEQKLLVLSNALREGCIGQLPEIYDGENPVFSKGCFAQAWSTGEILRAVEMVEHIKVGGLFKWKK